MERVLHRGQQFRERRDGSLEMRLQTSGRKELTRWILSWMPHVKVVAPRENWHNMAQHALDPGAPVWQYRIRVSGSQKQFFLTRAALGSCGSARSEIPISNSVSSVNWSNITGTNLGDGMAKMLIVNLPAGNRFYRPHKP